MQDWTRREEEEEEEEGRARVEVVAGTGRTSANAVLFTMSCRRKCVMCCRAVCAAGLLVRSASRTFSRAAGRVEAVSSGSPTKPATDRASEAALGSRSFPPHAQGPRW